MNRGIKRCKYCGKDVGPPGRNTHLSCILRVSRERHRKTIVGVKQKGIYAKLGLDD